jgi:nucleoside-diphosphate-sugar epimerase
LGGALVKKLAKRNRSFKVVMRSRPSNLIPNEYHTQCIEVDDFTVYANWESVLDGVDTVVHCAGRAHVFEKNNKDSLASYRLVNVNITKILAEKAAMAGVRRFIFISSIGVLGNNTKPCNSFNVSSSPAPVNNYAVSKLEAENVLGEISKKTGMEIVIVRPPLIYGPGARGSVAVLLKLVRLGVPLPLKLVKNRRSLIGLDNIVDFLIKCIDHPAAAGQIFAVSDGCDLSTPEFLKYIAVANGRQLRLWSVPIYLLRIAGSICGMSSQIDGLVGSLQIDCSHAHDLLDWNPPVSIEDSIQDMVLNS